SQFKKAGEKLGVTPSSIPKFIDSCWHVAFYFYAFSFDCFLIYKYQLLSDTNDKFLHICHGTDEFPRDMLIASLFQAAYYIQSLYSAVFVNNRNYYFPSLVAHRSFTILLQIASYSIGFVNAGVIIEACTRVWLYYKIVLKNILYDSHLKVPPNVCLLMLFYLSLIVIAILNRQPFLNAYQEIILSFI
ncbi:hypothetical protein MXB_5610, partial [Myxobolus squamalis]